MGQAGGIQAGGRRQLGAIFAEPEPGLPAHLHVAGREDALASGARDTALVPVLIHLADQADALPLVAERELVSAELSGHDTTEGANLGGGSPLNLTSCLEGSGWERVSRLCRGHTAQQQAGKKL